MVPYKKINLYIILFFIFFLTELNAQSIKGRVLDATHNQPLSHASIINLSDSTGTTTDEEGYFAIVWNDEAPIKLQVSHVGYIPQQVSTKNAESFIRVTLEAAETNLHEVVVKASHINEKYLDVPATINILTRKQLERNDETIITPSLNHVPGVYMHSGNLNTNRIIIRGIGARTPYGTDKLKAYFDDIPLTSGEGETTLEDIDLSAIQRVEVIKGPTSSIYGAGLGGTINITSRTAPKNENTAHAQSLMGSYGLSRNVLQYLAGGNNSQIGLLYSNTHRDGYRQNSEYNRQSVVLTGKFYPNEYSKLSVIGTYTNLKAYIPSSINAETFASDPSAAAFTWRQARGFEAYDKASAGVSYQYELTPQIENVTSIFLHFRHANEPRPFDILRENTIGRGFRSRFIAETDILNAKTTVSTGIEYFNDWHEWSTYENLYRQNPDQGSMAGGILSDNEEQRRYYNVFAQVNVRFSEKLSLQSGLNLNRTHYELTDLYPGDSINQSGSYSFESTWSPRLGLTYKLNSNHALFAMVSHGFSPPNLAETLTPEGRINTDIQPETGWNYEVGSKGSWFNNKLYTEVSLYRMEIKNLLVAERVGPDTYIGVNAGKTVHNGLEALVNVEIADGVRWSVKPFLSATITDYKFDYFIHAEQNHSGNDLTGVPSETLNVGVDISSPFGFYFYSNYHHVGAIPLNDENSVYSHSYGLLNSKAGYQRLLWQKLQLEVSVGVNNTTNKKYAAMVLVNAVGFGGSTPRYYYPGLPRNYYGSISLKYMF